MAASVAAKGILLSITIVAGLAGLAAHNPQIQAWLEEQRKKIAELLRQIGEELDPQARRAAEAFAFEGRTIDNDAGLAREAEGSKEATALATGRRLSSPSTIRRIPIRGPSDPDEAEERRRKGREYLARRNQQLFELQQKRKTAAQTDGLETPPTPTFHGLVDLEGNLKRSEILNEKDLPAVPHTHPLPETVRDEMKQVERHLAEPIAESVSHSAESSGWSCGSRLANPFGDEYELERSVTPKPPVPPKIELDTQMVEHHAPTPPIPRSSALDATETAQQTEPVDHSALSYEEQLAIALSLSEQDASGTSATVRQRQPDEEDDELKAAIAASLKEMDDQQAAHAIANADPVTPKVVPADAQMLIDVTPSTPPFAPRNQWAEVFQSQFSPTTDPISLYPVQNATPSETSDELYRLTPELTKARLASHNEQQRPNITWPSSSSDSLLPFDPVRDAAAASHPVADVMDASFYSAQAEPSPAPSSATLESDTPMLVDYSEEAPRGAQRTPTSQARLEQWSSFSGQATDSESDTFASISATPSRTASRAESRAESQISGVEVIDLVEDSDVDMLSDEGDAIATPDSWSEVGSRDGDSDIEDAQPQQLSRVSV